MNVSINRAIDQDVNLKVWLSDQEVLFSRLRAHDEGALKILYNNMLLPFMDQLSER